MGEGIVLTARRAVCALGTEARSSRRRRRRAQRANRLDGAVVTTLGLWTEGCSFPSVPVCALHAAQQQRCTLATDPYAPTRALNNECGRQAAPISLGFIDVFDSVSEANASLPAVLSPPGRGPQLHRGGRSASQLTQLGGGGKHTCTVERETTRRTSRTTRRGDARSSLCWPVVRERVPERRPVARSCVAFDDCP